MEQTKSCGHCKEIKLIQNFYKNKQQKSGYSSWCKDCEKEKHVKYRNKEYELIKIKRKLKYLKNKEKENASNKAYNSKNKERLAEYYKQYSIDHKEYHKQYNRDWHEKNKDKINLKKVEYYNNNKEKIKKRHFENHKKRLKSDSLYKFKYKIKALIYESLKRKNHRKKSKTQEILGCSYMEFKKHIEMQFVNIMTWENYGSYWWYDHIIPLASAKTEEEVIKLNHYTNFQPLYWRDNIIKRDKII